MRLLYPIFLLLLFSTNLFGQAKLLRKDLHHQEFKIGKSAYGDLTVESSMNRVENQPAKKGLLRLKSLLLQDGDLVLAYEFTPPDRQFYYDLDFKLIDEAGNLVKVGASKIIGKRGRIIQQDNNSQVFSWWDMTEKELTYDRSYQLQVSNEIWGIIDCDAPPTFKAVQHLPYWVAAAAGGGLLAYGQQLRREARDLYNQDYIDAYRRGDGQSTGNVIYGNFEDRRNGHKTFTLAGIGILALDGLLYSLRILKHKKDLSLFNKYCDSDRGISIGLNYNPLDLQEGMAFRILKKY